MTQTVHYNGMFCCKDTVAQFSILQGNGSFIGSELVLPAGFIVVAKIIPAVILCIMEGIRHIRQEVGERFPFFYFEFALFKVGHVIIDCPDLQAGCQLFLVLSGSDKLKLPVMIKVRDGIEPFISLVLLYKIIEFGIDQDYLRINICRICIGSQRCRNSKGCSSQQHRHCKEKSPESFLHITFFLSFLLYESSITHVLSQNYHKFLSERIIS